MRTLLFSTILLFSQAGCGICDRMCDRERERDDLPPSPRLGDRFERDNRDPGDPNRPPPWHWFGPSRETPLNPAIPNLPPTREPTAPRAEDPSWRNR